MSQRILYAAIHKNYGLVYHHEGPVVSEDKESVESELRGPWSKIMGWELDKIKIVQFVESE